MKIFSEVIGNMTTDPQWAEKLKNTKIEYLELDQWTAQKSRFIAKGSDGQEYAVALKRHSQIENGDILDRPGAESGHRDTYRIETGIGRRIEKDCSENT